MENSTLAENNPAPVALITGGAKRLGAYNARQLHQQGFNIIIHYFRSQRAAENLVAELNANRPGSALCYSANLNDLQAITNLVSFVKNRWGHLELLLNNASSFYPTPFQSVTEAQWNDLFASNVKTPFFLAQACTDMLKNSKGNIVNMIDIHAKRPLSNHAPYCMAKSALLTMTLALAKDLAPDIRVNGISPGAILWPSDAGTISDEKKEMILSGIPLQKLGNEQDIADALLYLINSPYITGQIIDVDGGRSL